ncbi:MAG TPA: MFS transporter, partial [Streptosporangiaceae bacterium]|nr:MFS transporter [Streptosporangiaceae bacterium]
MKTRLLTMPLAMTFLAEFTSLTSFFLLLSVMPMLAAAHGAGNAGAGMVTGSLLLGTVIAEIVAAPLIGRLGYRAVLAAGATLLGVPTLALLTHQPQAVLVGISFVRGFGFGLCGVATGALTATLIPADRRGEGLGLLGIVSGVPAIVALPAGVWLAGHHNAVMIAVLALVTGLTPLTCLSWLPGGRPEPRRRPERSRGGALRVPLIFAASTV